MDEKLLFKYFRGETTSEEEDAILAWVEETPANRKEFKTAFMIFSGLAVYAAKPNAMPTASRSAAESGGKSSVIVCVRQLPSY